MTARVIAYVKKPTQKQHIAHPFLWLHSIDIISWQCGCVGIGYRRQPANRMGNTVEPRDEKPGQRQRTGKKRRDSWRKCFSIKVVLPAPEFS